MGPHPPGELGVGELLRAGLPDPAAPSVPSPDWRTMTDPLPAVMDLRGAGHRPLLQLPPGPGPRNGPTSPAAPGGEIRFEGVTSATARPRLLHGIDLEDPGRRDGWGCGATGSGIRARSSSCCSRSSPRRNGASCRWTLNSGEGTPPGGAPEGAGFVAQDPFTHRRTVAIGEHPHTGIFSPDPARVGSRRTAAELHTFVEGPPPGVCQAPLGERGWRLSGGSAAAHRPGPGPLPGPFASQSGARTR